MICATKQLDRAMTRATETALQAAHMGYPTARICVTAFMRDDVVMFYGVGNTRAANPPGLTKRLVAVIKLKLKVKQ